MIRSSLLALLAATLPLAFVAAQPGVNQPVQVGMAKSFFNDVPEVFIKIATGPFEPVMKKLTTLEGKLNTGDSAEDLATKLSAGKVQIAIFHGFEYAWAKQRHADLEPLLVAVNKHRDVRTFIIVHKDNPATRIEQLKGKTVAIAKGTKEHCRVYLARRCSDNNTPGVAGFFGKVDHSPSYEDALDDVCRKKVDATIVDTICLEFYKDIKLPLFTKHLHVIEKSSAFPEAVIAYKKGGLSEANVAKFRTGLENAKKDADGLEMMKMLNIHAFEPPPADFNQRMGEFLKTFPPEATKVGMR